MTDIKEVIKRLRREQLGVLLLLSNDPQYAGLNYGDDEFLRERDKEISKEIHVLTKYA